MENNELNNVEIYSLDSIEGTNNNFNWKKAGIIAAAVAAGGTAVYLIKKYVVPKIRKSKDGVEVETVDYIEVEEQ